MTDTATRPDGLPERRRAPRTALRLAATIRQPGRGRIAARILDISTHGCRIEATTSAAAGTWVLLSVAGLETQYCRIAWHCQEFSGLEFATPLAEPVLERLLQDQHCLSENVIRDLREIARRAHSLSANRKEPGAEALAQLSRQCSVDAMVEALRLGDRLPADR